MTPVTFNGLSGFVHEAQGDCAVILCGAIGYEQLCASRGWRRLGQNIAASGYPVLRFDWAGCGDSLGGDHDPQRLPAWRESLVHAVAFAKTTFATTRVVLIGLRLGATLATEYATTHGGVEALALLAPAVSGRIYGREMTALAGVVGKAAIAAENVPPDVDGIEVAGFCVTRETLDALREIDLRRLSASPAPAVLLLAPQGLYGVDGLQTRLAEAGATVTAGGFDGYAQYLAEPTFSRDPEAVFATCLAWLTSNVARKPRPSLCAPPQAEPLLGAGFAETPAKFGSSPLYGVLCTPHPVGVSDRVLVFVNSGANPRIGWARMHVEFARQLAVNGVASLRMDVAGLGDSPPVQGRATQVMYDSAPRADVSAALDWLQTQGYREFVVVGLCSGAHLAFHSAVADRRIGAIVMVNLQRFIWRDTDRLEVAVRNAYRSTDFYKGRALRSATWKRALAGEIDILGIAGTLARRSADLIAGRVSNLVGALRGKPGDTTLVRRHFEELGRRGVRALLVYSAEDGGIDELALHMGAQGARLQAIAGMQIALIEAADHNLTPTWARRRLLELIKDFIGPTSQH